MSALNTTVTAVVTGGASGIGAATARRLAQDGAHVAIFDLNDSMGAEVVGLIQKAGGTAVFVKADVTNEQSLRVAFAAMAESGQLPTVLVNSAGIVVPVMTSRAVVPEDHKRVWEVNYFGTFNVSRVFADLLINRKQSGAIVNLASTSSLRPVPAAHYTPGKYAIRGLTELMAAELGPRGIRVNAVAPTYTMTPPMLARIASGHRKVESLKAQSALKMLVTPEHVAAAIAFLASDQAEAITGVVLPVDAGWLCSVPYESVEAPMIDVAD